MSATCTTGAPRATVHLRTQVQQDSYCPCVPRRSKERDARPLTSGVVMLNLVTWAYALAMVAETIA